jgi:UDP-glucose 4-epimerase
VSDIVGPLIDLIGCEAAQGKAVNLGGVGEVSMLELAQRIIDRTGSHSKVRYVTYEEAYEEGFEDMARRVPDITRARQLIGFEPTSDLDAILDSVIEEQRG